MTPFPKRCFGSAAFRWQVLLIFCVLFTVVLFFSGIVWITSNNTAFSSGFSRAKFKSVREGESIEVLLKNLGLPLHMTVNFGSSGGLPIGLKLPNESEIQKYGHTEGGNAVLQYSECLHRYGDSFRNVSITIVDGRVRTKRNEVYHEWW